MSFGSPPSCRVSERAINQAEVMPNKSSNKKAPSMMNSTRLVPAKRSLKMSSTMASELSISSKDLSTAWVMAAK